VAGAILLALEFGFFLLTPRLLLDLPFKWRDLVPGAVVCTGAAIVVHTVAAFFLRNWFGEYGHAYGGFGISLALAAFVGLIASFWVWIAAVMGVYGSTKQDRPPSLTWRNCRPSSARHRRPGCHADLLPAAGASIGLSSTYSLLVPLLSSQVASAAAPGVSTSAMQHGHVQCVPKCHFPLKFAQVIASSPEVCETAAPALN
jgi:hypothetical protein